MSPSSVTPQPSSPGAQSAFYLSFFGLQASPFVLSPQPDYFFGGANREQALREILHFVKCGEGIAIVSGEIGSGKTMLLTMLLRELSHSDSSYASPSSIIDTVPSATALSCIVPLLINSMMLSPMDLAQTIANQLDIKSETSSQPQQYAIEQKLIDLFAAGQRTMLIIDEAHTLPDECLEWVRLLSNLETDQGKMLQILLFSQPELLPRLASEKLRALTDRITMNIALRGLNYTETQNYLEHRLRRSGYRGDRLFTSDAIALLAKESRGLSRRIHVLADKAILAAYVDSSPTIGVDHVKRAVGEIFNPLAKELYQPISEDRQAVNKVAPSSTEKHSKKSLAHLFLRLFVIRWWISVLPFLLLTMSIIFVGYLAFVSKEVVHTSSPIASSTTLQTSPSVLSKPLPKNEKMTEITPSKITQQSLAQKPVNPSSVTPPMKKRYHPGIFFDWPEASSNVQQWLQKSQQYFSHRTTNEWFLRIVSVDADPKAAHELLTQLNKISLPRGQSVTVYRFKNQLRVIVFGFSNKAKAVQAIPIWQNALRSLLLKRRFYPRPITSLLIKSPQ